MATLQFNNEDELFRPANSNSKFGIFELGHGFGKSVDSNAEAIFLKAITHLVKVKDAAMHRATAAFRRIQACAEPFEIRSLAAIHFDPQETSWRNLEGMFRAPLDGFRKILRRDLTEGEIDSR